MAIPVQGYPDYLIGEDGRIWSEKTHKYLKPAYTKTGYASVELFNADGSKRLLVHRLVARAFIPNPLNLPQVNHIDEDPRNNSVDNLEWCTAKYNMNYGNGAKTRHANINYSEPIYKVVARENGKAVSIPVTMYDKSGNTLKSFESAKEASRQTGISQCNILRVARGDRKTAGGYIWRREEG